MRQEIAEDRFSPTSVLRWCYEADAYVNRIVNWLSSFHRSGAGDAKRYVRVVKTGSMTESPGSSLNARPAIALDFRGALSRGRLSRVRLLFLIFWQAHVNSDGKVNTAQRLVYRLGIIGKVNRKPMKRRA